MKSTKYILVYFLFITNIKAQTNVYHPFPDTNAVWCETWIYTHYPAYYECNDIVFLTGDTTISGINYKKLFRKDGCYGNSNKGAIRQDSVNKKVYYCIPNTTTDTLLYNFNLNVGDTLPITYNNTGYNYVYSIDSILVGTTYRKKYNIAYLSSTAVYVSLIEGIGSTSGLLFPLNGALFQSFGLNCFSYAGQVVYSYNPNTNTGYCCSQLLTVDINTYNETAITIYPNPASDKIYADMLGNVKTEISLIDIYGRAIKRTEQKEIDVSGLKEGVYFVQIKTSEGILTKKIIVQH